MTRTVSSELMVPTLLQNQRATRRLRRPNRPSRLQSRGRGPARACSGFRLDRAGRRAELAGQEIQAVVEIGPRQLSHRTGVADQLESRVASCSPAQAMPINCWQTTSSGARDHAERLDPARPGSLRRDRRTGQLGGRCRQQEPARDGPAAMARAAHSLQATRHAARQPT